MLNSGDVSRTTKRTDLTNQLSNWNAGNISMNAGHDITLQGVNLNGANVSLAAGHNLSAIEVYDIKENVDINSSVSMFRQRVSIDINSERTAIGNSIGNGAGVVTRTAGNNILDRGTTIAGIAQSSIAGNRISEEAIKSTIQQEHTRTTGGAFWVSTQSQGSTQETLQMTNIFVPSNASRFQAAGGVSVQLPKGSDLRAQIDRLKGQPGNEYLGQLAERSDIDWQEVEVINKTWNYKKETMGPATAIIVAIAVSVLTGGMASSLGTTVSGGLGLTGTVAGKMVAASVTAGFSSLASMTATAVINNGGDLGAALEELGSSANVKSLLISMATAGAIQGITENIPVDLLNDKGVLAPSFLSEATVKNATFAQLLGKNMVSAIASATISSAVNGGSLEDSLKASLISAFLDTAAANGAYQIGNLTNDGKLSQTLAENFANKLLHGALGCAIGAAKANSEAGCASGAIGGVVGHLTAEAVKDLGLTPNEVQALGQITSVLVATLAQKDLNIASSSAQNAILNNRQLHEDEAKRLEALKLGKTKAQQDRLDAAACALVRCADGVPDSDANKQKLLALQTEGESDKCNAEKQMLKNTGLFVYKTTDMYGDILTKNKEIAKRLGGGLNAISGAAGAVGGGALVGAGVAACPVSFGLTCVGGVTLGGFIMVDEYGRSKDGVQNLLGAFVSDEGQRVLDSLNPSTYPGERDPLKEAGIDAAKNVGTALFGKYLLKTFAKLDGLDTKVEAKTSTNIACAAPPACFVAGTMVQTPNGLKAIETFKPGDLVYSKDQFTQAPGVRPVVGTKQTLDQLLYEVVVKNAQGQTETYTTTSEHPFWVTNGPANGQWLKASLLQAGLHLTNAQGETLEVVSQTALEQTATVYNIQVHEHSTYHVGEMGVWVHNATCCNVATGANGGTKIASSADEYVNILSTADRQHILFGDIGGGGHMYPGQPGKSIFPQNWTENQILHNVGDVVTSPTTRWYAQTGTGGSMTKGGDPAKWVAWEMRDGVSCVLFFNQLLGER